MDRNAIRTVCICNGTHGDELSGIELASYWRAYPSSITRPTFKTRLLEVNPRAVVEHKRYIDRDIQDCFSYAALNGDEISDDYELERARQIAKEIGTNFPKDPGQDLIIDLHDTTCSMGVTLNTSCGCPFCTSAIAYLYSLYPSVIKILYSPQDKITSPYLESLGKCGITVECGPQQRNQINADLTLQEGKIVSKLLDYVETWNRGLRMPKRPVPVYRWLGELHYRSKDEQVYSGLIGKDYQPVMKGYVLMTEKDKPSYIWKKDHTVWPCFIDEKSYKNAEEAEVSMVLTDLCIQLW